MSVEKKRVFISSVQKELEIERVVLITTLNWQGFEVIF
jgi:hypothetical protein